MGFWTNPTFEGYLKREDLSAVYMRRCHGLIELEKLTLTHLSGASIDGETTLDMSSTGNVLFALWKSSRQRQVRIKCLRENDHERT